MLLSDSPPPVGVSGSPLAGHSSLALLPIATLASWTCGQKTLKTQNHHQMMASTRPHCCGQGLAACSLPGPCQPATQPHLATAVCVTY